MKINELYGIIEQIDIISNGYQLRSITIDFANKIVNLDYISSPPIVDDSYTESYKTPGIQYFSED